MSRRSSRRVPKKTAADLPSSVTRGLRSLVEGNEDTIRSMLDISIPIPNSIVVESADRVDPLVAALVDRMAANALSAEALLAGFFSKSVLSDYCVRRLGKSGKGNEATLAARIGREWAKPTFRPVPTSTSTANFKEEATAGKKRKIEEMRASV